MNDSFMIYSVYDVVTERYSLPFYQVNDKSAIREVEKLPSCNSVILYSYGTLNRSSENGLTFNVNVDSKKVLVKDFTLVPENSEK